MQLRWWLPGCLVLLAGAGFWLDASKTPGQPALFWAICAASVLGVLCAVVLRWRWLRGGWGWLLVALIAFTLWRLAYFPVMVFAGFLASLVESALFLVHHRLVIVYPAFLVAVWAMHTVIVFFVLGLLVRPLQTPHKLLALLWKPPSRWLLAACAPSLLIASMVSFSALEDLRLLPDTPWSKPHTLPPVAAPAHNPYLPKLTRPGYALPQRVLLFCAGMTYPLIPHSPWAFAVKGTLERLTDRFPKASSTQRIREHYLAYLVAHRWIRSPRCLPPTRKAAQTHTSPSPAR